MKRATTNHFSHPHMHPLWMFILTLIVLFSSDDLITVNAQSAQLPEIIDQQVEIDYGEKISVLTTIDLGDIVLNAEVKEAIRILFRPEGNGTIWSYAYPENTSKSDFDFSENHVLINFEIPTGAGSYYPPGTEFNIEFEFTDYAIRISSSNSIEYLDPDRDWERANGNGYSIIYYGISSNEVYDLIEEVNSRIPDIAATTGVTNPPKIKAIVFPTVQQATPSFPTVSQTATNQHFFAGFAQPKYRLFVQGQMNSKTFTHELAHLYTHEAISSAFRGIPSWLDEGIARFLESGSSEPSNNRLRTMVNNDDLLSLSKMQTIPGLRRDVAIFYPQSGAFVGFLVEKYGPSHLAKMLQLINTGSQLNDAFEAAFGIPMLDVENQWRALFGADPLIKPSADTRDDDQYEDQKDVHVPLIDYKSINTSSTDNEMLERTTTPPDRTEMPKMDENNPLVEPENKLAANNIVAMILIAVSTLTGIWLFKSQRRTPNSNS